MAAITHNNLATNVAKTDNVVGRTPTYKTRRAAFALNKKKLTKTLKKDALIAMYETTVNNYNENVNIKCSSGFFLQVASPGFHDLAIQSSDDSFLTINNISIHCSSSRASLDEFDLLLNTGCSIVNDINYMDIVQAIWMLKRSGW